jgi:cell division protease FtsH
MKQRIKTFLLWILALLVFVLALVLLGSNEVDAWDEYDNLMAEVDLGQIYEVRVNDNQLTVTTTSGEKYKTLGVVDDEMVQYLSDRGVRVQYGEEDSPFLVKVLAVLAIALVVLAALVWLLRRFQAKQQTSMLSLTKSRARLLAEDTGVTFADVAGCHAAKANLKDIVDFLEDPKPWVDAGVRLPRGILLEGPPGCGKTLLARAVAGEAKVKFFFVSASEFVEMFVGVGAGRVRDMFEQAAKEAPAVIFIDEIDAIGRRRGSGIGSGHDEREQTLNQLLVSLDGFEETTRVVVLAATNRSDILDRALVRPGRFDMRLEIPTLDLEDRTQTFKIHLKNKKLTLDFSLDQLAQRADGMTGAEIEHVCNLAAMVAARRARAEKTPAMVCAADFDEAFRPREQIEERFDEVDATMIDSSSQVSRPTGGANVRVHFEGGVADGELIWANPTFLKIRTEKGAMLVNKLQIQSVESTAGTAVALAEPTDAFADQSPQSV